MDHLNSAQRDAVRDTGNLSLVSCPGSGKTRVIVAKLLTLIDEVEETPRRIGCITHTNAAVHEIEARIRERAQARQERSYDIATIHSFSLSRILNPFRHLLPEFVNKIEIVTSESEWLQPLVPSLNRDFDCRRASADDWANVCRSVNGAIRSPDVIPAEGAAHLIRQLDSAGGTTMGDIVYHAARLVLGYPWIARGLASTYAWLLIDEFQDTSDTQIAIVRAIASHGRTKFFIVGDPQQSIFRFSGARPDLMATFAREMHARDDVKLLGNYRSSTRIIAHAERLCARYPAMTALGEDAEYEFEPRYVHAETPLQAIWDHFLPAVDALDIPIGNAVVLAPQWIPLFHLGRGLRGRGVPIIGPGARPYRRSLEFAAFAEHACAFTEVRSAEAANRAQRFFFLMIEHLTGRPEWRVFSYDGKRTLYRILHAALAARAATEAAIEFLRLACSETARILVHDEFLSQKEGERVIAAGEAMVRSIETNRDVDPQNLSVADLSLFARPKLCLELMTIHNAKGREFDAVAVIDLHENVLPHRNDIADPDALEESRRKLYVAATRARKVLFYFTDDHRGLPPSRFLGPGGLLLLD